MPCCSTDQHSLLLCILCTGRHQNGGTRVPLQADWSVSGAEHLCICQFENFWSAAVIKLRHRMKAYYISVVWRCYTVVKVPSTAALFSGSIPVYPLWPTNSQQSLSNGRKFFKCMWRRSDWSNCTFQIQKLTVDIVALLPASKLCYCEILFSIVPFVGKEAAIVVVQAAVCILHP